MLPDDAEPALTALPTEVDPPDLALGDDDQSVDFRLASTAELAPTAPLVASSAPAAESTSGPRRRRWRWPLSALLLPLLAGGIAAGARRLGEPSPEPTREAPVTLAGDGWTLHLGQPRRWQGPRGEARLAIRARLTSVRVTRDIGRLLTLERAPRHGRGGSGAPVAPIFWQPTGATDVWLVVFRLPRGPGRAMLRVHPPDGSRRLTVLLALDRSSVERRR